MIVKIGVSKTAFGVYLKEVTLGDMCPNEKEYLVLKLEKVIKKDSVDTEEEKAQKMKSLIDKDKMKKFWQIKKQLI